MIDDSPEIQTTQAAATSPQAGAGALEAAPKTSTRPKPDAKPEVKSEAKVELKVEPKIEAKSDAKTEAKSANPAEPASEVDGQGPNGVAPPVDAESDAKPSGKAKGSRRTKTAGTGVTKSVKAAEKAANAAIEARIGHRFADPSLLSTAFTHVSALKSSKKRGDSYQRLEFLGDHVLGLIVSDMLYRAFPSADEGELSKRLADLVRKESCADVAKSLGLLDDIKLGAVGAGAGARLRKSVLGDVCEAVIGAIFLDGGYTAAAGFVERNWTERMRKPRRPLRDPKTVLQEWAQGKGLPTPVYREVERTGPHHDPQFRVAVDLPGLEPAEGVGGSKRAAEKVAASVMIEREGVSGGSNDG
ncbi:ribonuclease III (modular protein) [Bradyrhizobium sp. ORS 278]|uniref:ribonuclease III n=1 Tax=Bradyrhizobium sp. (strain ORS 278) TaxID=114615 RepID=UPI000150869B|nr:ribonuclease III [Bradyrhizobium sp. ORS 278]CAL78204.1 ribonuclease III (modular protein) [Bradyrhizobium sp. ORS 278]